MFGSIVKKQQWCLCTQKKTFCQPRPVPHQNSKFYVFPALWHTPFKIFLSFRMFQLLKFMFFNVLLSLFDVLSDLYTCIFLWEEGHPAWALLTAFWMLMPFTVGVMDFFARWMTFPNNEFLHCRIIEKWWRNEPQDYNTFKEFAWGFYREAVGHLPMVIVFK